MSNALKCEGRFLAAPASIKVSARRVGLVQDTHRLCCEKEDHRFPSHFFSACSNLLIAGSCLSAVLKTLVLSSRTYYDPGISGVQNFSLHLHQSKSARMTRAEYPTTDYAGTKRTVFFSLFFARSKLL